MAKWNEKRVTLGMDGWKSLHPGMVPCHRSKKSHGQWRWGQKKGLRRARRRYGKNVIARELGSL
jgi:hypothetical protein